MTTTRTLAELGDRVAGEGPQAYQLLLAHLAELVADTAPGTAAALVDPHAPAVVRERAVAVASAALVRRSTGIPTGSPFRLAA